MGQNSKWEYLKAIYTRYRKASKELRTLILNEFCHVTSVRQILGVSV